MSLSDAEIERAAVQIVSDAGTVHEAALLEVLRELNDMKVSAALWELWVAGSLLIGWNPDDGFTWRAP